MKLFVISDIHGSLYFLRKVINIFEKEKYDKILILGDELYHGPRNPLPRDYSPREVIEILNKYKDRIIAVRGNCDSEVDQMVLNYPIMSDYNILFWNNKKIIMTHGHIFNEDNLPPMEEGDILLYGHFHIPFAEKIDEKIFLNPGSISLPKENFENSYGVFQEDYFIIKNLEEKIIKKFKL